MPARSTKEMFIDKAKKIHGDKFDYSKVEYKNAKTKVCIICPVHGEFWQTPDSHLNRGCFKCGRELSASKQTMTIKEAQNKSNDVHNGKDTIIHFEKSSSPVCVLTPEYGERWFNTFQGYLSWKRTGRTIWTDEQCMQIARQYKTKKDFHDNNRGAYTYAYKHNLVKKMDWFIKPPKKLRNEVIKIYLIYVYKDNETKSIYVGLTRNIKQRHKEHIKRDYKGNYDSVGDFFYSINKPVPEPEILIDNLNSNEAAFYEGYFVNKFKREGWNIINKAACGLSSSSIGGTEIKWTYERCYNVAKECSCVSDFSNKYSGAFAAAWRNKWIKDYSWFTHNNRSSRKKEILQLDINGNILKKWKSSSDIEIELGYNHNNIIACCKCRRNFANGYKWKYA